MREKTTRAVRTAITVLAAIAAASCGDAERRWSTAALLDDDLGQTACGGDVVMDAQGNAVAVWCRHAANYQGSVWASRFILGEGWGPATRIDAANGGTEVWNPSLAVNAAGQAISAWSKYNGSSWGVWAARFDPSAGWDEPVLLDESGWGPGVALDNHGRATAVWTRNDDDYNGSIWTSSHEPSTGWGSTTRLDSDLIVQVGFELGPDGEEFVIAGGASQPKVAVNDNGNAVAVWLNYVSGSLWASPYLPGAGWGSPTLVGAPAWSFTPSYVAMDEAGRAIAVNLDGRASSYSPMDGWSSVTLGGGDYTTSSPNVAVAKNGQALVVWKEKREGQRISISARATSLRTRAGARRRRLGRLTITSMVMATGLDPTSRSTLAAKYSPYGIARKANTPKSCNCHDSASGRIALSQTLAGGNLLHYPWMKSPVRSRLDWPWTNRAAESPHGSRWREASRMAGNAAFGGPDSNRSVVPLP
ncbi:MAG: hypothetical protein DRH30_15000 [Deltaproteobacteria bacterium]|nr:MAG: hypothetical protein DRH30_15000 [Deltaproteobacteria bacterium]